MEKGRLVVAAVSGGVDSSVAAALALEQGFEVVGVTLQLRPCHEEFEGRTCCGPDAVAVARSVCGGLGIRHYVLDVSEEFEREVLAGSWREYEAGRTPNPCVVCNKRMKFGKLLEWAEGIGAWGVVSGHYATIVQGSVPVLRRGVDRGKDQSYFLATLGKDVLSRLLMPLGSLHKVQVREKAAMMGLSSATRKDSQDACFVPQGGSFPEYLREHFRGVAVPGPIVHVDGAVLGEHKDARMFTTGQRKGLRLVYPRPLYVVSVDPVSGVVLVSDDPEDLLVREIETTADGAWATEPPVGSVECLVQTRYRQRAVPALVSPLAEGRVSIRFEEPVAGVSAGQLAVCYVGDDVFGAGTITATRSTAGQQV